MAARFFAVVPGLVVGAFLSGCAVTAVERPRFAAASLGGGAQLRYSAGIASTAGAEAVTGRVLSRAEVATLAPHAVLGDAAYAEVNSNWLPRFYEQFREELYGNGILKWDARFTCRHFASYYAALAQARYYRESFHEFQPANSLAIGTFWYTRGDGEGHAIVVALTERGRLFIEPQSGKEVQLTPGEVGGAFLQTF